LSIIAFLPDSLGLPARPLTYPPIGQALANNILRQFLSAFHVARAKCYAVIVAEIEFGNVAMQMLLAASGLSR
jgi:hypothetical protein